jgi:hypothetical protein
MAEEAKEESSVLSNDEDNIREKEVVKLNGIVVPTNIFQRIDLP